MMSSDEMFIFLKDKFPELTSMLDKVGVLDIPSLMKNPYSALIGIIAGQRISFKRARAIRKMIYENIEKMQSAAGKPIEGTNFTRDEIIACHSQLNKLECWPIIERLNAFLSDKPINFLDTYNPKIIENIRSLNEVKGIGPWTIESTILCALVGNDICNLTDYDIFPVGDKFLQNALIRLNNNNNINNNNINNENKIVKLTMKEIKKITDKWSPYRGYITWYFWRWFPN